EDRRGEGRDHPRRGPRLLSHVSATTHVSDADAAPGSVGVVIGVVIVAAGSGSRLGAHRPKAFVELAGKILLQHALDGALAAGATPLPAAVPAELMDEPSGILEPAGGHGPPTPRV